MSNSRGNPTLTASAKKSKAFQKTGPVPEKADALSGNLQFGLERLSLLIGAEIKASVRRQMQHPGPRHLAFNLGVSESTVYTYGDPKTPPPPISMQDIPALAISDSDPEFFVRLGNLMYRVAGAIADARTKRGSRIAMVETPRLEFE